MPMNTAAESIDQPIRTGAYPELTPTAVIVGYFLGVIIAISIGYAALILGFSIEGSELAAILGFAILRGMLRRSSIIEVNIVQTVASAVNGASSGMMFSVPALFILAAMRDDPSLLAFNPYLLTFGCIAGAFLGIGFIIPLRKQMIDYERLTYPGGVAVATILKSPGAGIHKALILVGGALLSATVHVLSQLSGVENWALGEQLGWPEYLNATWYLSLLTIGVGYIAGRGGVAFVIGGFVCYWFLAPLLSATDALPVVDGSVVIDPNALRGLLFRPVGIGMLIGGALAGVLLALPLIISAVRSMQNAARTEAALSRDEMPVKLLYVAIAGAAVLLAVIAVLSTEKMGIGRGIVMAVTGTLWIWMAGVILSEAIGRTNWSPLSGMTLIAVTILIFISSGLGDSSAAIIAAVMVGAATCVAMSQATDLMLDLKTGYLVGATPRMQQMGQFLGAWLGPIVIIALIFILHQAYGLGSEKLPAPQGQALASMVQGIVGGDVPMEKYLAGAGLGALLSATSAGLGILVGLGFYLPFNIVLTYSLGTLLRVMSDWRLGNRFAEDTGIPFAAGLIVGEALIGVGFAVQRIAASL